MNGPEKAVDCENSVETIQIIPDHELSDLNGTEPSTKSESSLSFQSDLSNLSNSQLDFNDPFEGILYRTDVLESKYSISFVSSVLFDSFKNKMHADYMSSVDIDETTFMSKCATHINGVKCDIKLDAHFKTVELSGMGFQKWREERFPRITQFLLKRVVQKMDSIVEGTIKSEQGPTESTESADITLNGIPIGDGTSKQQCDVNDNVAPRCNVAQLNDDINGALNGTNELMNAVEDDDLEENTSTSNTKKTGMSPSTAANNRF